MRSTGVSPVTAVFALKMEGQNVPGAMLLRLFAEACPGDVPGTAVSINQHARTAGARIVAGACFWREDARSMAPIFMVRG